ncbi:MAG: hypothetical protein WCV68_01515 [Candidatus Paceibacterota bacterium]|jgi:hypothetical protein
MTKIKNLWQSKFFKGSIWTLVTIIAVLVVFQAGRFVGFHQASFSYRMGDNYYRAFEGGPREGGMMKGNPFGDLPGGHGAVGKVIKVNLPNIVISTPDNLEKTVFLGENTSIRRFRDNASSSEIKVGDMVVVIGEPNQDSVIEANLIRLLPPTTIKSD